MCSSLLLVICKVPQKIPATRKYGRSACIKSHVLHISITGAQCSPLQNDYFALFNVGTTIGHPHFSGSSTAFYALTLTETSPVRRTLSSPDGSLIIRPALSSIPVTSAE